MRPLAKAVVRVLGASAGALLGMVSVGILAVRQPSMTNRTRVVGSVASVDRLRADVAFLTRDAAPRDFRHPGNLDLAARHIHEELSKAGAVVVDQPYVARGGSFRNVIARLGPAGPGALVIGAHYDAFGDRMAQVVTGVANAALTKCRKKSLDAGTKSPIEGLRSRRLPWTSSSRCSSPT